MVTITDQTCVQSGTETDCGRADHGIARIRFSARDSDFRTYCDAVAYDDRTSTDTLMVLSAMGPQTSVKALAAILQGDTKVVMRTEDISRWYDNLGKHPDGYTIHRQRFDHNTWHVLAVAKQDGLLLRLSEQSLWAELRNLRFTTPLLRSWMPWLMETLIENNHLRRLKCFGCESAILTAGNLDLDEAVMRGLKSGMLQIA